MKWMSQQFNATSCHFSFCSVCNLIILQTACFDREAVQVKRAPSDVPFSRLVNLTDSKPTRQRFHPARSLLAWVSSEGLSLGRDLCAPAKPFHLRYLTDPGRNAPSGLDLAKAPEKKLLIGLKHLQVVSEKWHSYSQCRV